jgi:hypothetical protein
MQSKGILPPQGVGSFEKQNSCFDRTFCFFIIFIITFDKEQGSLFWVL